jgi:mannose-1-phosphate guanylyltransferase/mannose-6-phosphate isomerase-like protein (cupin superfamily)
MPSDHVIKDAQAFQAAVREGACLAEQGYLVTFGVTPAAPVTGYGYIKRGEGPIPTGGGAGSHIGGAGSGQGGRPAVAAPAAHVVSRFVEKPDAATAKRYLESGDYLWNSGVFLMRASVWLRELWRYRRDIAEACEVAFAGATRDALFLRPDPGEFGGCPSESIDYAVMEKAAGSAAGSSGGDGVSGQGVNHQPAMCAVVDLEAGWSDVGAWSAVWELGDRDASGNVVHGDVYVESVSNALLMAQHRMVAAVGLEDVIVVETADAVLVARKDSVQDVKEVVARLKEEGRPEHENQRKVPRPWGSYEVIDKGDGFQVKRLTIKPGAALSLQMHKHRAEHWVVVRGTARVTRGDQVLTLTENESTHIPFGVKHRLMNPGAGLLEIIEVQSGSYLGEDDIVRFEDGYNRHKDG